MAFNRKSSARKVYLVLAIVGSVVGAASSALADGTETLGPPSIAIASGSGFVTGGTGLASQPGTIMLDVPAGATVQQVLLYWAGEFRLYDGDSIRVNGVTVTGELIGGPTLFYAWEGNVSAASFRADITDMNIVTEGVNQIELQELNYDLFNSGAGAIVIYDDGTSTSDLSIVDGLDLAFFDFEAPRDHTVPQTFSFTSADTDRVADLAVFAGSIWENRPNSVVVTVGGEVTEFTDPLAGVDGEAWDSLNLPVEIPAGAAEATVQLFSSPSTDPLGASVMWVASALGVPTPTSEPSCVECDGGLTSLTLQYNGHHGSARVVVYEQRGWRHTNVLFDGVVQSGETFTVASDDVDTLLPSKLRVKIGRRYYTSLRTSCRRPLVPGTKRGKLEVVEALTLGGEALCAEEVEPDLCDEGKPQTLTFRYTGEGCERRWHHGSNQCWGDPADADPVYIVVSDRAHRHSPSSTIWFEGWVNLNDTFTVDALAAGADHLGKHTWVRVYEDNPDDSRCALLQKMLLSTSCRRPIREGSTFGSLELVDYIGD